MKLFSTIKKMLSAIWRDLIKSKTKEKTREAFKKAGVFPIIEEISPFHVDNIQRAIFESLLQYKHKKIYLVIKTNGGDLNEALCLYDFLKSISIETEVIGIVMGRCYSSGLTLLAGCSKRLSFKNTRFLLHGTIKNERYNILSPGLENYLLKSLYDFSEMVKSKDTILKENFGLSDEAYQNLLLEGKEFERKLSAEEAKELGIIDEIIFKFPFQFSYQFS